jgi:hypothetical protein
MIPALRDPALRDELVEAVAKLAVAIDRGDVTPELLELQALAVICAAQDLPDEAARIRRWLGAER